MDGVVARTHRRARQVLDVPEKFNTPGPAAEVHLLAAVDNSPEATHRSLATGISANAIRHAERALPVIASGAQRWVAYCDLLGKPYFRPTSSRVCAWAMLFNPVGRFGQYLSHLIKAFRIIGAPTEWEDTAVGALAEGLRKDQDLSLPL